MTVFVKLINPTKIELLEAKINCLESENKFLINEIFKLRTSQTSLQLKIQKMFNMIEEARQIWGKEGSYEALKYIIFKLKEL